MAEFPTYEQMANDIAEKALDEFLYEGKTIREWIKIITEQEPKIDGDCISRQTVLDIDFNRICLTMAKPTEMIRNRINDLPSVQSKTEWIPVSERLPEKNDIYVVWTSKGFGNHLSTSYYSIDDGWTIEVCAWKENGEPYKEG